MTANFKVKCPLGKSGKVFHPGWVNDPCKSSCQKNFSVVRPERASRESTHLVLLSIIRHCSIDTPFMGSSLETDLFGAFDLRDTSFMDNDLDRAET